MLDNSSEEQLKKGIILLEKSLQQDHGYTQARLALADALCSQFKMNHDPSVMQRAMDQGKLARQETDQWAPAQLTWSLLLKENGERASAMEALQETLRLNERCYLACIEMAKANEAVGKINEAEKYFKHAIDLRPGYPSAFARLAFFYMSNGRIDEAITFYREQVQLAPGDLWSFNNLGILYQQKGETAKAKAMFEKSITIEPNVTAQTNLGTLFFYEGDYRKALPHFQEAALHGTDSRLWGNLADTYRQLPEFRDKAAAAYLKAIDTANEALTKNPEDHELLSALGMYYAHSNEKGKALESIDRARGLAPAELETIRQAILVYEAMGERTWALNALREFCERLGSIKEIEKEPDLSGLRRDPEYLKIVQSLK